MPKTRSMPEPFRALRKPWPSLAGSIDGLTPDLEARFRAGQRVSRLEQNYRIGGSIKGGSSSIFEPATEAQHAVYRAWAATEALGSEQAQAVFDRLVSRLAAHRVELRGVQLGSLECAATFRPEHGEAYELILGVIEELPETHLERPELEAIRLGGWGPDAAKASAYTERCVHMYDFAMRGARRTFCGLLLHELGHAQAEAFPTRVLAGLLPAHRTIGAAGAFYGLEFLATPAQRQAYQRLSFTEFLAEAYMGYAAGGAALRTFIASLPLGVRDAWRRVYTAFKQAFDGREYA
ncbi:MAG: hypothetical protein ACYS22_06710 [Planctomycetota bacterium]|jgi:hypothetical protein